MIQTLQINQVDNFSSSLQPSYTNWILTSQKQIPQNPIKASTKKAEIN